MVTGRSNAQIPSSVRFEPDALRCVLDLFAQAEGIEPCGLLVGGHDRGGARVHVSEALALTNEHERPQTCWSLSPEAQLEASRGPRVRGLRVVGTWHGHPHSSPHPGKADLGGHEAFQRTLKAPSIFVIVGRGSGTFPVVRAYATVDGLARELPIRN